MIYLITGAGEPNFGDELIALNWIRHYRAAGYAGPIFVDCKTGTGARKLHDGQKGNDGVRFGRFFKTLTMGKSAEIDGYVAAGRSMAAERLAPGAQEVHPLAEAGFNRLEAADDPGDLSGVALVHLVGGGYVNGDWKNSFSLLGAASELARRLGVPAVATGLGMSPLHKLTGDEQEAVRGALSDFALFELRDETSARGLALNGIRSGCIEVGLDDSFLAAPMVRPLHEDPTLHVSLFGKHLEGDDGAPLRDLVAASAAGFKRVILWQCSPADAGDDFAKELGRRGIEARTISNRWMLYEGLPVQRSDALLTSRFHPHLLAARAGIGGIFVQYSKFYKNKHGSVVDLGSLFVPFRKPAIPLRPYSAARSGICMAEAANRGAKRAVAARIEAMIAPLLTAPAAPAAAAEPAGA